MQKSCTWSKADPQTQGEEAQKKKNLFSTLFTHFPNPLQVEIFNYTQRMFNYSDSPEGWSTNPGLIQAAFKKLNGTSERCS